MFVILREILSTIQQTRIEQVVAEIQARYGHRAVQLLADYQPPPAHATGIPLLDTLLGGGLLPGVLTVLQGRLTSGRVTLAQRILAQMQTSVCVYLDVCGTFDSESAVKNGVNLQRLVIVYPEDQLDSLLSALLTLRVPFIVLDESGAEHCTTLSAVLVGQLAQAGTVLLNLPPDRQTPQRAGARLMVEKLEWIRCERDGDILGCRSQITVFEQRGVPFGSHITLDLLWEGA
jgi:predicted ATP-dependent serine protease